MPNIDYVVIGGGGGGGAGRYGGGGNGLVWQVGGGGGAASYETGTFTNPAYGAYTVTVGGGGTGAGGGGVGSNGGNSVFNGVTSYGGGYGQSLPTGAGNAASGGSGGGKNNYSPAGGGAGSGSNVYAGGNYSNPLYGSFDHYCDYCCPSIAQNFPEDCDGSCPRCSGSYWVSAEFRAFNVEYTGGSGGGYCNTNSFTGSSSTYCCGGAGGYLYQLQTKSNFCAFYVTCNYSNSYTTSRGGNGSGYGGGGGGGAWNSDQGNTAAETGANGNSGVVIVKYLTADYGACTGGTITTSGSYTIHSFTSSGTFTLVQYVAPTSGFFMGM